MPTSYELVDLDSGNLVGSYLTLEQAFETIRDAYVLNGWSAVTSLGLMRVAEDGSQECVAVGPELARRAIREAGGDSSRERSERTA